MGTSLGRHLVRKMLLIWMVANEAPAEERAIDPTDEFYYEFCRRIFCAIGYWRRGNES